MEGQGRSSVQFSSAGSLDDDEARLFVDEHGVRGLGLGLVTGFVTLGATLDQYLIKI